MTAKEINDRIAQLEERDHGALPPSVKHQLVAQEEETRAVWEVARQLARLVELVEPLLMTLAKIGERVGERV